MLPNLKNRVGAKALQLLTCAALALGLAACGGGGGSPGTVGGSNGGANNAPKLTLALTDQAGTSVKSVSTSQKGVLKATLVDGLGKPIAGVVVNFAASDSSLVTFEPASASALTDASGVATVRLGPASVAAAGALALTASTTVGTAAPTATLSISVGAIAPKLVLSLTDSGGAPIATLASGQKGTLKATLTDDSGKPLAGNVVNFATSSGELLLFEPSNGTALTDAAGVASVRITPASLTAAGALTVTANSPVGLVSLTGALNLTVGTPQPRMTVAMTDLGGTGISTIYAGQKGVIRTTLLDDAGRAISGAVVTFATTGGDLLVFDPVSATALTNASGVATVQVSPSRLSAAGAVTVTASAQVGNAPVSANVSVSVGASQPKISFTLSDAAGAAISSLSGGQKGVLRVTLTDSASQPLANQIVNFTASNAALILFEPASASALTDNNGVAVVRVTPASVNSSGALSITATSVYDSATLTSSVNMAVGAAPLTVGALSFNPAPTGKLPAFSAVSLNIPVTSGGAPATSVTGLLMTSLCVGDGLATLVPGSLSNGVQSATYTNNGCLRGTDVITVSIGNSSQTISIGVDPANIGTIQFIGTDLNGQSIVLKGSGGLGRKETAVVTFRVVDQNNNGLAGVDVNFRATTSTGGLTVLPAKGTSDASGNVTTTVSSGSIPTPVRVIAEATRNGKVISGLSDSLIISTGLPIQKSLSLSSDSYNIEGWDIDGEIANLTVRLADQFGNPISDNTAVNFVSEGGAIGSSAQGACLTANGGCTVPLKSQNFRPTNGRVTVLAYVQGIENFTDSNGDGQYSCTNYTDANGAPTTNVYRPLVDICVSGGEPFADQADAYLDAGNPATIFGQPTKKDSFDGSYDAAKGDQPFPYNHSTYSATGNGKWGLNYIIGTTEITFSGSTATLVRQFINADGSMRDWLASDGLVGVVNGLAGGGCAVQTIGFRLIDLHNNPLPKDTVVATADVDKVTPLTVSPNKVISNNRIGGTYHTIAIKPETACAAGYFSVAVTTPKGLTTLFPFRTN